MTAHPYDVVERFRDLGGRLIFLSANKFFWRVEKQGDVIAGSSCGATSGAPRRAASVRSTAPTTTAATGVVRVVAAEAAPWLFDKTGLVTGSTFGESVGGYGIEIDAPTPASPAGTVVVAPITDLFGPGVSGEMTYYETPAGARSSPRAARLRRFGTFWPVTRMLENLWQHMLQDIPAPLPRRRHHRPRPPDQTADRVHRRQTSQAPSCCTTTPSTSSREPSGRRSLTMSQ